MVFLVFCMFLSAHLDFFPPHTLPIWSRSSSLTLSPDILSSAWFILPGSLSHVFSNQDTEFFKSIFISSCVLFNVSISLLNSVFHTLSCIVSVAYMYFFCTLLMYLLLPSWSSMKRVHTVFKFLQFFDRICDCSCSRVFAIWPGHAFFFAYVSGVRIWPALDWASAGAV